MPRQFTKDPQEVLDYTVDWGANILATGETISTSTWTVPSGITKDSDSKTSTTAVIWLSGGTADTDYDLTNKIVTSGSRTFERTITIGVRQK